MATTQFNLNLPQTDDNMVRTVGGAISGGGSAQFTFDNSLTKNDMLQIVKKFEEYLTGANALT